MEYSENYHLQIQIIYHESNNQFFKDQKPTNQRTNWNYFLSIQVQWKVHVHTGEFKVAHFLRISCHFFQSLQLSWVYRIPYHLE